MRPLATDSLLILTISRSFAFTPLIVSYTVEILPYPLRAKGFTIFNFSISLSLIFNQYVNPVALDAIAWKYYVRPTILSSLRYTHVILLDRLLLLARIRGRVPLLLHH